MSKKNKVNTSPSAHNPARPLKFVKDKEGNGWLCDAEVDPNDDLPSQSCWECGSMNFTRND